ncbi:MAG: hypothetical protein KC425_14710 [Anaerolineales bacterium]|nr:hypothetical protein [Anaerolineales bacterium]
MKLLSLFDSQQSAETAVNTLAADPYDSADVEVIESIAEVKTTSGVAPSVPAQQPAVGAQAVGPTPVPIPANPDVFDSLSLEPDEKRYLTNGIRHGGVVLMVTPNDASVDDIKAVLQQNGGKVLTSS